MRLTGGLVTSNSERGSVIHLLQTKYPFFYGIENVVQEHLQAWLIENQTPEGNEENRKKL